MEKERLKQILDYVDANPNLSEKALYDLKRVCIDLLEQIGGEKEKELLTDLNKLL